LLAFWALLSGQPSASATQQARILTHTHDLDSLKAQVAAILATLKKK
jgi:hypothetical protein